MDKETLHRIEDLAKFVFEESEYNRFMKFISEKSYHSARIVTDFRKAELELIESLTEDKDEVISQYDKCNTLEDLVMYLIIENEEVTNGEGLQFRHVTTE